MCVCVCVCASSVSLSAGTWPQPVQRQGKAGTGSGNVNPATPSPKQVNDMHVTAVRFCFTHMYSSLRFIHVYIGLYTTKRSHAYSLFLPHSSKA